MSLLPTHRGESPAPTLHADPSATQMPSSSAIGGSTRSASTQVGDDDIVVNEKKVPIGDDIDRNQDISDKEALGHDYEDKGIVEIDDGGERRKVRVVVENRSGKELIKEMSGGPYTEPRWRHSLPFVRPKYPPPPPPLSLDDPPVTPEVTASFFSMLFFNWVSPMLALGSARSLQPTDLWKMDDNRSAAVVSVKLAANIEKRLAQARAKRERLASKSKSNDEKLSSQKTPAGNGLAIAWALSDTFGWYFWMGSVLKIIGDASSATSPLVIRALINWSTQYEAAMRTGTDYPSMGRGVGLAIALLCMLLISSMMNHHFFVRSMGTGVMARTAIISSIYNRSLRMTQKSRGEIPNGKIVNHISTDTSRIDFGLGFAPMAWTAPVMFIIIVIILLVEIGYSALPGIGFLIIALPAQTVVMKRLFALRKKSMLWTDKRAKLLQEILGGMRIVKFMAWETPFLKRLQAIRALEVGFVRRLMIIRSAMMAFAMSLPVLAAILSFVTYSLTSHGLNASTLFTTITLFQLMRMPLMFWPMSLSAIADMLNAFARLEVVYEAEVLTEGRLIDPKMEDAVRIENASFTWDAAPIVEDEAMKKLKGKHHQAITGGAGPIVVKDKKKKRRFAWSKKQKKVTLADQAHLEISGGAPYAAEAGRSGPTGGGQTSAVPGLEEPQAEGEGRIFKLKNIDLSIPRGSLTAIVGPIGSGKSSLLQGLMGEMRRYEGKVIFSGSTALCTQTPWIQNATIRENILFGQPWNEERYWAAVRDSCLESDLELLTNGDSEEIGERGINLSGGQKQRVGIARALYFDADVIALDDPLSALDAGVGKALFFNAILGALSGKTRILVTHALHFLPYVDNIILMDDGQIVEQGTYNELKTNGKAFARLVEEFGAEEEHDQEDEREQQAIEFADPAHKIDRSRMIAKITGKGLMQEEERNTGAMKEGTYLNYFKAGRGLITIPLLFIAVALAQTFTVLTSFWLAWWQEERWDKPLGWYLGLYAFLGLGSAIALFFQGGMNAALTYFASVALHQNAIKRVMFAPQSFFDTTPLGRIMSRFAKDIDTLDNTLPDALRMALQTLSAILGAVILLAIIEPYFLIAMGVVAFLYAHNAAFYRRSSREFKRIDAILRSSLYAHFSESLSGIGTIRAYGESERFCQDNIKRMDIENRAYYLTIINQRWLGIRLDFLGSLLTFSVAIIVVCSHRVSAASGGLGLSTMITVQQSFSWLVRQLAEVENDMVGAERIMYYANELEQEAPHQIEQTKPPANWPSEGRIEFDDVRMRYRPELPDVLKGLSLSVGKAEKVGVVGRTGAGKSSIMASLFRMSELSGGAIKIDGVDVSKIGLNDLRSGISIIPQDPLLFSGTLRSNIDPFNTKTDAELYDALKRAHLIPKDDIPRLSGELPSGAQTPGQRRFTLDTVVEEEGGNLSVGERSLVSLARALVRDTKVLVLDEATASVDVETDSKIQQTIREEFGDKTLLCIAHRLRTIISYDKILVMSDGRMEEFDTPLNLYDAGGFFTTMCQKSSLTRNDLEAAASLRF
ncbi:P-loop containing nucleoside triphosphate hydrolase protein [Naematelia encephala]|uniref:p-loop containing nucleoside triphosphate hydrolase protein n=1 Tax=Naematelia encephala TaxID=71784 RepID=A0A1Y2BLT9_9TREE|nr:P-loop containing nucleoside triphosphate hydrolase protein [Naematelia encephala]